MTETRANIELILATITDGIVVVNQHGIVLYANQSAEHIFERGNLLGRDLAIPLSPSASYQDINLIRRSGIGWAELRSSLITWEGQAAYVISVRDITERKKAEEVLRKSKDLLQSVVETAPLRIFWKDRDLRYLGCNTSFAKDAGFTKPDELTGKTDFEMGWRDQAELYRADDKAVMESGNPKLGFEEPADDTGWQHDLAAHLQGASA